MSRRATDLRVPMMLQSDPTDPAMAGMLDKSPVSMHRPQVNYRPAEGGGQIEQNPSKLMTRVRFPSPAPSSKSKTCPK